MESVEQLAPVEQLETVADAGQIWIPLGEPDRIRNPEDPSITATAVSFHQHSFSIGALLPLSTFQLTTIFAKKLDKPIEALTKFLPHAVGCPARQVPLLPPDAPRSLSRLHTAGCRAGKAYAKGPTTPWPFNPSL